MSEDNGKQLGEEDDLLGSLNFEDVNNYLFPSKDPCDSGNGSDALSENFSTTEARLHKSKEPFVFYDDSVSNGVFVEGKYHGSNFSNVVDSNDLYFEEKPNEVRVRFNTDQAPVDRVLSQEEHSGYQQASSAPPNSHNFANRNHTNNRAPYHGCPDYNNCIEYKTNLHARGIPHHNSADTISPSFKITDTTVGVDRTISQSFHRFENLSCSISERSTSNSIPGNVFLNEAACKDDSQSCFDNSPISTAQGASQDYKLQASSTRKFIKSAHAYDGSVSTRPFLLSDYTLNKGAQVNLKRRIRSPEHHSSAGVMLPVQTTNSERDFRRTTSDNVQRLGYNSSSSLLSHQNYNSNNFTSIEQETKKVNGCVGQSLILQNRNQTCTNCHLSANVKDTNINRVHSSMFEYHSAVTVSQPGYIPRNTRTNSDNLHNSRGGGSKRYLGMEEVVLVGLVNKKIRERCGTLHEEDWIEIHRDYHVFFERRTDFLFSGSRTWKALRRHWKKIKGNRSLPKDYISNCVANYEEISRLYATGTD